MGQTLVKNSKSKKLSEKEEFELKSNKIWFSTEKIGLKIFFCLNITKVEPTNDYSNMKYCKAPRLFSF